MAPRTHVLSRSGRLSRPAQRRRDLRAFAHAFKLGLLGGVRVAPGACGACGLALHNANVTHAPHAIPVLPLPGCDRAICRCEYVPVGSDVLAALRGRWLKRATKAG